MTALTDTDTLEFPKMPPFKFGRFWYVPSLGLKAAEHDALLSLKGDQPALTYPLLSFMKIRGDRKKKHKITGVERISKAPTLAQHLRVQCDELYVLCTNQYGAFGFGLQRAMIDVGALDAQQGVSTLARVAKHLGASSCVLTPVTDTERTAEHNLAVRDWNATYQTGVAMRVARCAPVATFPAASQLRALLGVCKVSCSECDLVIDAGSVDETIARAIESLVLSTAKEYMALGTWRSVTILSGAFPKSIKTLPFDQETPIVRADFALWRRLCYRLRRMKIAIAFGDYGMVHPVHVSDGGGSAPKANLRYTLRRTWQILRREKPPAMPVICQRVRTAPYFEGPAFSVGDEWIHNFAGKVAARSGSESWTEAGLSHHMAFAARQAAGRLKKR